MTAIVKKVLKAGYGKPNDTSNSLRPPNPATPLCPPSPDLSNLTSEELNILNDVFRRQERFEEEEKTRVRQLESHIRTYEEQVHQQATVKNKRIHVDLRLCRLCYKTKFADGIGRVCHDCKRRVCNKCGSFTRPKWDQKRNKSIRGKWRCTMCQMKRELLCQTGIWFHGPHARPTFNRKSFKAKIEASGMLETESDWGTARDRLGSESNATIPGHRTDSELLKQSKLTSGEPKSPHKLHRRRSQMSVNSVCSERDDDDADIDDEQFQRERQKDRQERIQKRCRRKLPKIKPQSTDGKLDVPSVRQRNSSHCSEKSGNNSCSVSDSLSDKNGEVSKRTVVEKVKEPAKTKKVKLIPTKGSSYFSSTDGCTPSQSALAARKERAVEKKYDTSPTHCRIIRQEALSKSSSSASIISDAKSSDLQSPAASPVFQRQEPVFRESPKISIRTSSVPAPAQHESDFELPIKCPEDSSQLLAPPTPTTHRRVTLSECENITINNSSGEQGHFHPSSPHHVILYRDKRDQSCRTAGLGMRVVGGKAMDDGSIGAYVTYVVNGGPAEAQANVGVGDIILEWNGRSLANATFEEARDIMDQYEDMVQLVVLHLTQGEQPGKKGLSSRPGLPKSDSADAQLIHNKPQKSPSPTLETPKDQIVVSRPKRRMLPKTPIEIKRETKQISGRLLIKLSYTPATCRLTVATIRAEGLKPRTGSNKTLPRPILLLYLLPGRNETGHYETQPGYETTNPEWNKTFTFAEISKDTIQKKALEITVWDKNLSNDDEFLGEVLLDFKDANLDNEAVWYSLEDHDDNSSPLPIRKKSFSDISPISSSSSIDLVGQRSQGVRTPSPSFSGRRSAELQRCLPLTPAHDKAKQLLIRGRTSPTPPPASSLKILIRKSSSFKLIRKRRGSDPSRDSRSDRELPASAQSSPLPSPGSLTDPDSRYNLPVSLAHRDSFTKKVKRKMSSAMTKMIGDKKESDDDRESCSSLSGWLSRSRSIGDMQEEMQTAVRSPRSQRRSTIQMDLLAPPRPLSRTPSQTSFEDDDTDGYSFHSTTPDRPAPEGDDVTSMLGPGQAPPKPSMEKAILGDIKLGFMVSKGQLEVDVVCAKGLSRGPAIQTPDTYVKTYLMEGNKKIQRKKTRLVKASYDPIYRQKLKYSACNVYGRCMRINIWEKQKTFDKKLSLGETVVRLDNLDLSQLTMGWYKLFQISATELGSTESLNW